MGCIPLLFDCFNIHKSWLFSKRRMQMMNSACLSNGQIFMSHLNSCNFPCTLILMWVVQYFHIVKLPHLAVIEGVGVVAVARVLLVAVEAVVVGFVQEVGRGGGETLDSVRVLLILVVLKILQEILGFRNNLRSYLHWFWVIWFN